MSIRQFSFIEKYNVNSQDFIEKYKELKSATKMGEYYHVDRHTINDYAHFIGFDYTLYAQHKLPADKIDYILQNYTLYTNKQLADKLNITESAVSSVLHRNQKLKNENRSYKIGNESYFENIDSQDKAYYLGFICSDGYLYKNKNFNQQSRLRIAIHNQDVEILEKFKQLLQTDKPLGYVKRKNSLYTSIYVSLEILSNKIVNDIMNLGITYRKTYGNCIPNIDEKYMFAFLRGYIDGDGYISKNYKNPSISITGFYKNLSKIQQFCLSKNIFSSFTIDKRKYNDNDSFGSLVFGDKTDVYCLLKMLYQNTNGIYLTRKYNNAKAIIDNIEQSEQNRDKRTQLYYKYAVYEVN